MLLAIDHYQAANHNGGQLQIGPDGKLWLATGDGGGSNNAFGHSQDPGSRLGNCCGWTRTRPRWTSSSSHRACATRGGSRSRRTGRIVIADVGQGL